MTLLDACGGGDLIGPLNGFTSAGGLITYLHDNPSTVVALDEIGKKISAYDGKGDTMQKEYIGALLEAMMNNRVGGKGYSNNKENPIKRVFLPNLNLFGSTQIEPLTEALSSGAKNDGFVQRLLFVPTFIMYPRGRRNFVDPPVPEALADELRAIIRMLATLGGDIAVNNDAETRPSQIIIQMDQDALDLEYAMDDRKIGLLKDGRMMWVRCVQMAMKIAALEAIAVNPEAPRITAEGLLSAARLVDWFTTYAESHIETRIADNAIDRSVKKVFALIAESGADGIARNELTRKMTTLNPRQLDDALKTLLDGEQIVEQKIETGRPGRPKMLFRKVA
jgi:hypothetical protein